VTFGEHSQIRPGCNDHSPSLSPSVSASVAAADEVKQRTVARRLAVHCLKRVSSSLKENHIPVDNSFLAWFEAIIATFDGRVLQRWVQAMRCVVCGAEMHLLRTAADKTMMVPGYEHHSFECSACREAGHGLTFTRARRSPTGRTVQIHYDTNQTAYTAKDVTSGWLSCATRKGWLTAGRKFEAAPCLVLPI